MKAKKWLTIITLGVTLVALLVAIYANYKEFDLAYDFSMAIFGSALLGFIMSLIEYFAERRKAMEAFLKAAYKIYSNFRQIKYVDADAPHDLIVDCIAEEQHNELCRNIAGATGSTLGLEETHPKRDEYIAWMEENVVMSFSEDDDIPAVLITIYNHHMDGYKNLFMSRIDMYIGVANMDFDDLSNAYGNLDFLFGNNSIRQNAFDSIYKKLQEWRNQVLSEAYHFRLLKDNKGNFAVCIRKLFDLNDMFFDVKTEHTSNETHMVVHQTLFDDLSDKIEEFRAATYFKREATYEKRTPILSKIKMNNSSLEREEA